MGSSLSNLAVLLLFLTLTTFARAQNDQSGLVQSFEQSKTAFLSKPAINESDAKRFFDGMLKLADSLGAKSAAVICERYFKDGRRSEAEDWHNKAIDLFSLCKQPVEAGLFNLRIGKMLTRDYDFETGIPYLLEASAAFETSKHYNNQVRAYNALSLSYHDFGVYDKGIMYAQLAVNVLKERPRETNLNSYWYAYNNMGINYDDSKRYKEAISCHLNALPYAIDGSDSSYSYNNLGNTYKKLGRLGTAQAYFLKAINCARSIQNDDYHLASIYSNMIDAERLRKNYKQAFSYLPQAALYAERSGSPEKKLDLYYYAHQLSKQTGDAKAAIAYLEQYIAVKDSFFTQEKNKAVLQLQARYEFEKQQKYIAEAELKLAEEALQSRQKNSILIMLALIVLTILLLFRNFRTKARLKEKQLILQNLLIEEQGRMKIQQQRSEISRELHDSLGSHLTFINATLSNMKHESVAVEPAITKKINALTEFSNNSIAELKNALWVLNTEKIYLNDLKLKFLNFINSAAEAKEDVKFSFNAKLHSNPLLESKLAANLFRVFQEMVNNAIKHSKASTVEVSMWQVDEGIVIQVKDNGVGFDYSMAKGKSYGLSNIETRLAECNADLHAQSLLNEGTTYRLTIKLEA